MACLASGLWPISLVGSKPSSAVMEGKEEAHRNALGLPKRYLTWELGSLMWTAVLQSTAGKAEDPTLAVTLHF